MKKIISAAFVAGIALSVSTTITRADSPAATAVAASSTAAADNLCGITASDLAAIKAIQNNTSLSYSAELQQELAARRSLLSATIQCAATSAIQLQTSLNNSPIDPSLENIKSQLLNNLNSAISYYDLQSGKVDTAGISGTESIARAVLTWRGTNYAPLAENVVNFIAWSDNQKLFTTADNRLAQINNLINSPLFAENTQIQNNYEEAAVSLKAAKDQNSYAKNAFAESLPPDQTLIFIEHSLNLLSSTYQHFFDISNLVQSLLPH